MSFASHFLAKAVVSYSPISDTLTCMTINNVKVAKAYLLSDMVFGFVVQEPNITRSTFC